MLKFFYWLNCLLLLIFAKQAAGAAFIGLMEWDDDPATISRQGAQWSDDQENRRLDSIGWKIYENPGESIQTATAQPEGFAWYYEYTIVTGAFSPQALLLELGAGAQASGFANFKVEKSNPGTQSVNTNAAIGTYTSNDFTNLPAETFGLAFTDMGGQARQNIADTTTVSFWSVYRPTWANVFTNCGGGGNRAWNEGFLRTNPNDDPHDGVSDAHILAPVPELSTSGLFMGILALTAIFILRKNR